jgi:Ser/Thr protein kinase RdoA (MazF antagonist)
MDDSQTTDLFLTLTPDKVLEAVEAAGLRCSPVCYPLNSYENRVYEVELDDGRRVVGKFYRPGRWTEAQILEEHAFTAELEAAEIPVCPVLVFPGGGTLRQIDHIHYCLFDRRGGRAPDEVDEGRAARLGMLAARMHNVGAVGQAEHRLEMNSENFIHANLQWVQANATIPPEFEPRYMAAAERIAAAVDAGLQGVSTHRVHGDFHLGNVIEREGLLNVLDFDDFVTGPAVQDLWLVLQGRDLHTRRLREVFIEAYEQLRAFDRATLGLIEPLRGLRQIHYSTWLARRWHDPVFPVTWPHFGTINYWMDATADLEEIVELIDKGDPVGSTDAPEAMPEEDDELTNADLFWDWEE